MAKTTLNLRMPQEIKAMLEAIAKRQNRSLTNTIEELIIREYEREAEKK
jgi:predicted HicB family RNase H-like nuclease